MVEVIDGLSVPTLPELARIKSWLLLTRDAVRDYLDTVVLLEKIGDSGLQAALQPLEDIYGRGPGAGPPLAELADRLAAARPADKTSVELRTYKGVVPPWDDWGHLQGRGRLWAGRIASQLLGR
ncbi:MAG: hypothetical protein ACRD2T_02440 [Thermoanaerobaculia bacterium]